MSTGPTRKRTVAGRRVAGSSRSVQQRRTGLSRPDQDAVVDDATAPAADDADTADDLDTADREGTDDHAVDDSDPIDDGAEAEDSAEADDEPKPARLGGKALWLPVAGIVLAVVVAVAGTVMFLRAQDIRAAAGSNDAVIETGPTVEVTTAVREGLERIFSFKHDNVALTEAAAKEILVGDAAGDYEVLFQSVRDLAPTQQLTLKAAVRVAGVSELEGDKATLLVYMDQTATRAAGGESTSSGSQLTVEAVKQDGTWRLSGIQPI
ncbi:nuclear transport factor 2 family protein [Actinokineospora pegani]|uniref:nuclear transport factor 2 family protein n=1 Tax=Actinokineospora pegani TaxID=2654637 RepID=UPI0012EA6959|nr:nuclear transport factor 2 family protein [Actinokineospora pegani]